MAFLYTFYPSWWILVGKGKPDILELGKQTRRDDDLFFCLHGGKGKYMVKNSVVKSKSREMLFNGNILETELMTRSKFLLGSTTKVTLGEALLSMKYSNFRNSYAYVRQKMRSMGSES